MKHLPGISYGQTPNYLLGNPAPNPVVIYIPAVLVAEAIPDSHTAPGGRSSVSHELAGTTNPPVKEHEVPALAPQFMWARFGPEFQSITFAVTCSPTLVN